ncbi:MAG: heparinase II/III family protein [Fimbriimonadaceae bacterium]|nr:heparinase II/III family protein [Fimbriimonadaceae bacterium]
MLALTLALLTAAEPLPVALALADSAHRDRWGLDGYHAAQALDGRSADRRLDCWVSDNWEVTHSLVLLLPQRADLSAVRVTWWAHQTPRRWRLEALAEGAWRVLVERRQERDEAVSELLVAARGVEAVRLSQPPDGAHPEADRRLQVADVQLLGEPAQPVTAVALAALQTRCERELRELRQREDEARVAPVLAVAEQPRKTRGFQGIIDRDDLARGRRNAAQPWAQSYVKAILADADWWVAQPPQWVWGLLPAGNPRAICPSFEKGCPLHGGARLSFTATLEAPYRWKCRQGGEVWGDGLAFTNPGNGAQLTIRDDGSGWLGPPGFAEAGRRYYFTAAYRYFLVAKLCGSPYEPDGGSVYRGGPPLQQLALAYALTGDRRYARVANLLLVRLADLYGTWDGCIEGPTQRQDGYLGQTFERFLVQTVILAADLVWDELDDPELHRLLTAQGHPAQQLGQHLQRNLLGRIYEYLHRLLPYFDGDFVMYEQTALAALAKVLDNPTLVAEALDSDVGTGVMLRNSWFRDGKFIYDSTGYNVGNAKTPLLIAEWLHGYTPPGGQPLDLHSDPRYRLAMLYDFLRDIDCDGRPPQIGDVAGPRQPTWRPNPPYSTDEERARLRLPALRSLYEQRLLAASGGDLSTLRSGHHDWWLLFHAEPLPPQPVPPAPTPSSRLFEDGGLAILRAGRDAERRQHLAFTFSKGNYAHGHGDKLAINLFERGWDLTADLGYPTTWTDRKYHGWETHTASHCTVMVDAQPQRGNVIGRLLTYAELPAVGFVEASAPAYPQCSEYRRLLAQVRDEQGDPLYVADLFRVRGGQRREYLFHSLGTPDALTVTTAPASAPQPASGTLAGPDVEWMSQGGAAFIKLTQRWPGEGLLTARWQSATGAAQPDRWLLTRQRYREVDLSFELQRTGQAGGPRERAVLVFAADAANPARRRVVMLPADSLPVGQWTPVTVRVRGEQAEVSCAGQRLTRVDVTGQAGDEGSVGLLHYYDYDWLYRKLTLTVPGQAPQAVDFSQPLDPAFWQRIDPTYRLERDATGEAVLRASSAEQLRLTLAAVGAPARSVLQGVAEGYGVRGQSPLEGHLILRDTPADPNAESLFQAVLATTGEPQIRPLPAPPGATALTVRTADREDLLLTATDETTLVELTWQGQAVRFRGRGGLLRWRHGALRGLSLVGSELSCGGQALRLPGTWRGQVDAVDEAGQALEVTAATPPPADAAGRPLLVSDPRYVCPAVYTVTQVAASGPGHWRLALNLPFLLAAGSIGEVQPATQSFASRTPVSKLAVNPGLFDGKVVQTGGHLTTRLKAATPLAFRPLEQFAAFQPGGTWRVLDVGVGDQVELTTVGHWTAP